MPAPTTCPPFIGQIDPHSRFALGTPLVFCHIEQLFIQFYIVDLVPFQIITLRAVGTTEEMLLNLVTCVKCVVALGALEGPRSSQALENKDQSNYDHTEEEEPTLRLIQDDKRKEDQPQAQDYQTGSHCMFTSSSLTIYHWFLPRILRT